jgi:hypothetical protein
MPSGPERPEPFGERSLIPGGMVKGQDYLWSTSNLSTNSYPALYPGVQRLERGTTNQLRVTKYALSYRAEDMNVRNYTSTSPYIFMAWC